jgi:hypothetical protein
MQALDELMRRCRDDDHTLTYRDLLDLHQALLQPAAAEWKGLTDADINHLICNTHPENRCTLVERAEQLLRELNGQPQKEQKLRPDFLAGYDAGMADAKRIAERERAEAPVALDRDAIAVNLLRHAGLDKHKARECADIVLLMLAAAPQRAPQAAQPPIRQSLTDPENQPNQYGFSCFMRGQKMAFKIGNQTFTLDYEPDETEEFDFMRDMLANAFSTFTPDVKTAPQAEHVPEVHFGKTMKPETLRIELQKMCSAWGAYWRGSDAHGVELTTEQAVELLQNALNVEVEIKDEEAEEQPAQQAGAVFKPEPVANWNEDRQSELNDWFLSLPEGRQKALISDKWMLAGAAFIAGKATPIARPLSDEQDRALCEAHFNAASDEYFSARKALDFPEMRRIFYAGFRKAWIVERSNGIKGD